VNCTPWWDAQLGVSNNGDALIYLLSGVEPASCGVCVNECRKKSGSEASRHRREKERLAGTLRSSRQARPSPGIRGENCCTRGGASAIVCCAGTAATTIEVLAGAEAGWSNGAQNGLAGRPGVRQAGLSQGRMAGWRSGCTRKVVEDRGRAAAFVVCREFPGRWGGVRRGKADSGGEYQVRGRLGERGLVVFLLLTGHPTQH
jgi:hypothetical protein